MASFLGQAVTTILNYVLQVPGSLSGTVTTVQDGAGNSSALGLSTSQVNCAKFTFSGHTLNTSDSASITITPAVTFSGNTTFNGTVTGITLSNPATFVVLHLH